MKKRIKALYIFVAIVLSVACLAVLGSCSEPEGSNVLVNGDFYLRDSKGAKIIETRGSDDYYKPWISSGNPAIPHGWEFHSTTGVGQLKQLPVSVNNDVTFDAINFFEISHGTTASHSYLKQQLSVKKNTYYRLTLEYQTWGTTVISGSNLKFLFGEDIYHQHYGASTNTGQNDYQPKWNEITATVNTRDFDTLTLYVLFGGDCRDIFNLTRQGVPAPNGSPATFKSVGTARIKNIRTAEIPTPASASSVYALGINRGGNLITNPDFVKRNEDGEKIKDESGADVLDRNADGTPISWDVSSLNPAKSVVTVELEQGDQPDTVQGVVRNYTSKNNHIRISHTDFNYTTVTQRIAVEKDRCYRLTYYLYIPNDSRKPAFTDEFSSQRYGVYPAVLQDRDFILKSGMSGHVFNNPTESTTSSRWISSGQKVSNYFNVIADKTGYVDFGVSFGSKYNPVKGEVWFYSFNVTEIDPADVSSAYRYNMQTNTGFNSEKTGKIITLVFLGLFTAMLFVAAVFLAANALSKKKGEFEPKNGGTDGGGEPEHTTIPAAEPLADIYTPPVGGKPNSLKSILPFALIVLAVGLVVRIAAALLVRGDKAAIDSLAAMAGVIQSSDLASLIGRGYFIEPIKALFLAMISAMDTSGSAFLFMCKLPNILADVGIAFVLTLFAGKNKRLGLVLAAVYLFNPFTVLAAVSFKFNTVALLLLLLAVYCLLNKRFVLLFAFYTAALLVDINALILSPVLLVYLAGRTVLAVIHVASGKETDGKSALLSEKGRQLWLIPVCAVASLLAFYLISLPLTIDAPLSANPFSVFGYYFLDGATRSGLYTKNGLSLFTLFNLNGKTFTESFSAVWYGVVMSLLVMAAAGGIYFTRKKKNSIIILLSLIFAVLFLSFFLAGTAELTGAAVFALFLAAFAVTKDKRMLIFAFAFSMLAFVNLFLSIMYAYDFTYLPDYLLNGSINPLFDGGVFMDSGAVRMISIALSTLYLALIGLYVFVLIGILFKSKGKLLFKTMRKCEGNVSLKDSVTSFFGKE